MQWLTFWRSRGTSRHSIKDAFSKESTLTVPMLESSQQKFLFDEGMLKQSNQRAREAKSFIFSDGKWSWIKFRTSQSWKYILSIILDCSKCSSKLPFQKKNLLELIKTEVTDIYAMHFIVRLTLQALLYKFKVCPY